MSKDKDIIDKFALSLFGSSTVVLGGFTTAGAIFTYEEAKEALNSIMAQGIKTGLAPDTLENFAVHTAATIGSGFLTLVFGSVTNLMAQDVLEWKGSATLDKVSHHVMNGLLPTFGTAAASGGFIVSGLFTCDDIYKMYEKFAAEGLHGINAAQYSGLAIDSFRTLVLAFGAMVFGSIARDYFKEQKELSQPEPK